jgi:hypothetical protein
MIKIACRLVRQLSVLPAFQSELLKQELQAAADAKVTTLATISRLSS